MDYKHHVISNLAIGSTTVVALDLPVSKDPLLFLGYAAGLYFGSLLPDIDKSDTKVHKLIPLPTKWVSNFVTHRGFTHDIFGLSFFVLITYAILSFGFQFEPIINPQQVQSIPVCFWFGLVFGYVLHLIEDYFSIAGLRFFGPFSSCDKWAYEKYGTKLPKVHHWKRVKGKNIPCRHFWGRGYTVGEPSENAVFWCIILVCASVFLLKQNNTFYIASLFRY